jgi:hypothetical protein
MPLLIDYCSEHFQNHYDHTSIIAAVVDTFARLLAQKCDEDQGLMFYILSICAKKWDFSVVPVYSLKSYLLNVVDKQTFIYVDNLLREHFKQFDFWLPKRRFPK